MDSFNGRRVLVTGARGFIGIHMCRRLLQAGAEVYAVSRRPAADAEGVSWRQADLANFDAARHLLDEIKPAVIFHLAGLASGSHDLAMIPSTFRDNLQTTVNLLTAAAEAKIEKIVLTGSMEEPSGSETIPRSPYAASKWACTAYARMFYSLYGTPVVNTRVFMVYGPEQPDQAKLIPYVIRAFLHGETPKLASGARLIDWIFVEDVVGGLLRVAQTQGLEGETIDIGSGSLISIRDLVQEIHAITGSSAIAQFGTLADRPNERQPVADAAGTQQRCGWVAPTPLRDGLRMTVDWYRRQIEQGALSSVPTARR